MVRVKIFDSISVSLLEKEMNGYLANVEEASLINVKITSVREGRGQNEHAHFIGLILMRGE